MAHTGIRKTRITTFLYAEKKALLTLSGKKYCNGLFQREPPPPPSYLTSSYYKGNRRALELGHVSAYDQGHRQAPVAAGERSAGLERGMNGTPDAHSLTTFPLKVNSFTPSRL